MATKRKAYQRRTGKRIESDQPKRTVYDVVTDRIVALLEAGTVPWHKPWGARTADGVVVPCNLLSRRPYRGINAFLTACQGYPHPYWLTFNQARSIGASVRKGQHGTPVIFWNWVERERDGERVRIPFVRYYTVFNVDQCDGIDPATYIAPDTEAAPFEVEPIDACDALVDAWSGKPAISHGGNVACYVPALDLVRLPAREAFESAEAYYATLFHELGHSTGHASRLKREGVTDPVQFGSHAYSREELVAEMTSAFLGAVTGLDAPELEQNHAAYCASWVKVLRADAKAVVIAAAQAQKAADMIVGTAADAAETEPTATETAAVA